MTDYLLSVVDTADETMGWEGSDDWIRLQFKAYLLCLLSTVGSSQDVGGLHQFNGTFCQQWVATSNYKKWANTDHPKMEHFHKGHPFQGDITITDVKLRWNHIAETLTSEETRRKIEQGVARTGQIVEGAYNSAKSALTSARGWLSEMLNEVEFEMKRHNENQGGGGQGGPPVTEDPDSCSSQMVISDRERKGEVQTIGDVIDRR